MEIQSVIHTNGTIYSTIWKNGEMHTDTKELNKHSINLANNEHRTLIDYDEGFCGLRLTWEYNCEPFGLEPSEDEWRVSWTLVEDEWQDIPDKAYTFMDKQLEGKE
mgnify:CR=1 FL=1|tara:strand:- start:1420 stop:1737 length:318 start_codon:yes stop_codon:yes gene_type:complete